MPLSNQFYVFVIIDKNTVCCMQGMRVDSYNNELLHLSEDLARRMLPSFETPTGVELLRLRQEYVHIVNLIFLTVKCLFHCFCTILFSGIFFLTQTELIYIKGAVPKQQLQNVYIRGRIAK
jgi:hypothetical protein